MITWQLLQHDLWALLAMAIMMLGLCAWWLAATKVHRLAILVAVLILLGTGRMVWPAWLLLALLALSFRQSVHSGSPLARRGALLVAVIISYALFLHWLPGFHNWLLVKAQQLSPSSVPYRLYVNFDKAFVPLLALLYLPWLRSTPITRSQLVVAGRYAIPGICLVVLIAWSTELIAWQMKYPEGLVWWALINFWLVCLSEEVLFRGIIQRGLVQRFGSRRDTMIVVASVLFGLRHWPGGHLYVLMATVAGLVYGLVYDRTGQIKLAVVTHFALNLVHIIGFTYPMLRA